VSAPTHTRNYPIWRYSDFQRLIQNQAPAEAGAEEKPKKTRAPKSKKTARPSKIAGYSWRKDGAGWQLMKSVYE